MTTTTPAISGLELAVMERRLLKMKQESALRTYRRKKAAELGTKGVPGQHPESIKAQAMVKQVKALEAKSRAIALAALTAPDNTGLTDAVNRFKDGITAEAKAVTAERHLIYVKDGKTYLMAVNSIDGDAVFAAIVGPAGEKVKGTPMTRLSLSKNRRDMTIFASLEDALAYKA